MKMEKKLCYLIAIICLTASDWAQSNGQDGMLPCVLGVGYKICKGCRVSERTGFHFLSDMPSLDLTDTRELLFPLLETKRYCLIRLLFRTV